MNIGKNIQRILEERNMKQADLCKKTEISSALMSNYISGTNEPGIERLARIAKALSVSIDKLVYYDEQEPPQNDELKKTLLSLFDMVPDDQKSMLLEMLRAVLKSQGLIKS